MTASEPYSLLDEFDDAADAPGRPVDRRSIRGLAWAVLRHPGSALTEIADRGGRLWLAPTLALALIGTLAAVVAIPATRQATREAAMSSFGAAGASADAEGPDAEMAATLDKNLAYMDTFTGIAAVVGSILSPFIALLVLTAVLHLVGTTLGGQQSFGQMLAVASWARLPLIFQEVLRLAYGLTGGFDQRPSGLSGLVAADHLAGPVLAEVSVWNLWTLALLAVAVGVVSRVSRRKAAVAVLIVVLLRVALGEVGVVVGRFFSGFGG